MKYINRLVSVVAIIALSIISVGSLSAYTLPSGWESVTSQTYTTWYAQQSPKQQRLTSLIARIDASLPVYSSTARVQELLEYIRQLAVSDLASLQGEPSLESSSSVSVTPSTSPSATSVSPQYDISGFDENQAVLIGSDSTTIIGEFAINARLETFILEEMELVCEGDSGAPLIDTVTITNEAGVELGTTSLSGSGSTIDGSINMDYMLEQGEEDFYVLVTTQNLGSTSQELLYGPVTCGVSLTEATGVWSSTDYSSTAQSTFTFSIQPVVVSAVAFVEEFEGFRAQETISSGNESTLGMIAITVDETNARDSNSRDEELDLQSLTVSVSGASESDFSGDLLLQRLDQSSSVRHPGVWIDTTTLRFDLSGSSDGLRIIEGGETAGYRILGTTTKNSGSIKFVFQNLDETALTYTGNSATPVFTGVKTTTTYVESPSVRID